MDLEQFRNGYSEDRSVMRLSYIESSKIISLFFVI